MTETQGAPEREANLTVRLDPPDAAKDAEWLTLTAWQGGGSMVEPLEEIGPGRYRTTEPVPLYGEWKSLIRLHTDGQFRTSVPHIFAVGDVTGGGLAATAMEQGRIAALHAFDQPVTSLPELVPNGIYAIPEIGTVGATEEQLTDASLPYVAGIARWTELARGLMTGDETGMLKLLVSAEDHRVLGVHVIGTGATELVHIGQAVMAQGAGGLDFLVTAVFNYPTFAESYKVAALDAANRIRGMHPA